MPHRLCDSARLINLRRMSFASSCMFSVVASFLGVSYGTVSWVKFMIVALTSRSKQNNYDEVVESVARHLSVDDPSKIRLTSHNCYSQQPKPQPIKYRSVEHLADMLVHYNQVDNGINLQWISYFVPFLFLVCCNILISWFVW